MLSLALWTLCPNILAHDRLITTDAGAAALGISATYLYWKYLRAPSRACAGMAGLALGLAQLTKFSMLLFFLLWPAAAIIRRVIAGPRGTDRPVRPQWILADSLLIVGLAVLVINAGYLFERSGIPLGEFELASRSLTRPVKPGEHRPRSRNPLLDGAWKYRVNRFRGTILAELPVPLPEHFVLGFDEQKLEAEGVPKAFLPGAKIAGDASEAESEIVAYPAYLNGKLIAR